MTFEDVFPRFWDAKSDDLVQPPLTDEALREAERELGVTLPEDYVALLRQQNGGVVADACSAFPMSVPTGWAPDHARMRAVEPELDRLLPVWIRKRRVGWAGDEQRLRELNGR